MRGNDFDKIIASLESNDQDFSVRSLAYSWGSVKLFYIAVLTDKAALTENIIKPLVQFYAASLRPAKAQLIKDGVIYVEDCTIETDVRKIETFILLGNVVILFSNDRRYIVANIKKVEQRPIPEPRLTYTIRGPQDCFNENLDTNLSLIRYRMKDKNLKIKNFVVGVRTKTRVAVIYIEDIANDTVVSEIQKRIEGIDIDGIGESGELQAFLLNNKFQLFPLMGLIERSDMAFHSLLDGKVLVVVDGSGIVLMAPKTFSEFFYSCDDRYDNKFFGLFSRILRYMAFGISLTTSSIFVAVVSFHTDILSSKYAISLAEMRANVPFPALVAVLILELIAELIREALLRVPKQIGSAVAIVGAIIIGQAAISAQMFSPLLLIIVAASLLASFVIPDYSLVSPFRILKFGLILITGLFGFFGFAWFLSMILIELVSLNSFGVPYMAPWAPFNSYDFKKTLMTSLPTDPKRPHYLRTKDNTKTPQSPTKHKLNRRLKSK